jgi:hypothetical protein
MTDVAHETAAFLRTQLWRGELDHAEYIAATEGLLRAVEQEPRLAPTLPLVDRGQLLLTPTVERGRAGRLLIVGADSAAWRRLRPSAPGVGGGERGHAAERDYTERARVRLVLILLEVRLGDEPDTHRLKHGQLL